MRALAAILMAQLPWGMLVTAAETTPPTPEADTVLKQVAAQEGYVFSPPSLDERRDVFHDLIAVEKAERDAAAMREKAGAPDTGGSDTKGTRGTILEGDNQELIEEQARTLLSEVRGYFLRQEWLRVMELCDKHTVQLNKHLAIFDKSEVLKTVKRQIRDLKQLAEEKHRYEMAKKEFDALQILVEGIIWSAEGQSLAIINKEEFAQRVNDKVREGKAVIVSIDRNRVDFMVVHDANTFHFQRYVGEAE